MIARHEFHARDAHCDQERSDQRSGSGKAHLSGGRRLQHEQRAQESDQRGGHASWAYVFFQNECGERNEPERARERKRVRFGER